MSSSPKPKRQKTGKGAVSTWPIFSERLDENKHKDLFMAEGYLKALTYLSGEEITAIKNELQRYIDQVVPDLKADKFYEERNNKNSIIRLERMLDHDEFFKDLANSPSFNGLADLLLDMPCESNNVQYFSKPPGAKCTPPHQDGRYFMHGKDIARSITTRQVNCSLVEKQCEKDNPLSIHPVKVIRLCKLGITFWLALDDVDEEIGCMFYVPRSFKNGELPHKKTTALGFSQGLIDFTNDMQKEEIKMEVPRGTLLGHHPYTVHRAGENKSDTRWRPALGLTYWAKSCRDDQDLHKRREEYKKSLYAELTETGRI